VTRNHPTEQRSAKAPLADGYAGGAVNTLLRGIGVRGYLTQEKKAAEIKLKRCWGQCKRLTIHRMYCELRAVDRR